jgi:exopolysaccharide biosynthesis polyprenyl glycosylphosphotransferase
MDNVETLSQTGSDGLRRLVAAQELGAVPRLTAVPEQTRGSLRTRLRRSLTWEIGLVTAVVVGLGVALRTPLAMTLGVLLTSLVVNYYAGLQTVRPGLPHIGRLFRDMSLPIAGISVLVAAGLVSTRLLGEALIQAAAATAVGVTFALGRRLFAGQIRMVVVGDRMAIADAATRWAEDRRVRVVGALLMEPEATDGIAMPEDFGIQAIHEMSDVGKWVDAWEAHLVVVSPGRGITSQSLRELGWHLEDTSASLAVLGVLDSVAPHRIDTTHFAGVTLIQVRTPRPSSWVRLVKAVGDRVAAAALLAAVAPFMMLMMLVVRLDSKGPAIFKQQRVGLKGELFTMYKVRTMHTNAEEIKAQLATQDEGNGVLFKIRHDPRITRVGRLLRKTSLDELPQLFNVLKGEMSLVGPRPALPVEVAQYNFKERRRLAVRPGLTGLWQVSGRSDLDWDTSVDLDLRYADNYRLTDDLVIGLRTVDAVVRSKGAY